MSDPRAEAKAWRLRNSDGRNTFERERTQEPPTWDLIDTPYPTPAVHPPNENADPESGYEASGILHKHVWDESLIDPDAPAGMSVEALAALMEIGAGPAYGDGFGNGPGSFNGEVLVATGAPAGDGDGHALDEAASDVRVMGDD